MTCTCTQQCLPKAHKCTTPATHGEAHTGRRLVRCPTQMRLCLALQHRWPGLMHLPGSKVKLRIADLCICSCRSALARPHSKTRAQLGLLASHDGVPVGRGGQLPWRLTLAAWQGNSPAQRMCWRSEDSLHASKQPATCAFPIMHSKCSVATSARLTVHKCCRCCVMPTC